MSEPDSDHTPPTPTPAPIRWKALWTLLGALAGSWIVIRLVPYTSRQYLFYREAVVILIGILGLLIWLLISRLPSKPRNWLFGSIILIGTFLATTVRIVGVDGNLLPIFGWKWKKHTPGSLSIANHKATVPNRPEGAIDWPQFLGPTADTRASVRLKAEALDFKQLPPPALWKRDIGSGWAGFAVSNGTAITLEQRGEEELVVAYNLLTGEPIWQQAAKERYFTTLGGEGPRSTPTIRGDKVFTLGATGILQCLALNSGQIIWKNDLRQLLRAPVPEWGFSPSPVVDKGRVIVPVGGPEAGVAAFAESDGQLLWKSVHEPATYVTPALATIAGKQQLVHFGARAASGLDPDSGRQLWRYEWPGVYPRAATPVIANQDEVIISSGYGCGAARLKISARGTPDSPFTVDEMWRTLKFRAKFACYTLIGQYLYGLDDGQFACLDATSGERIWRDGDYGHGQQILCGEHLLIMAEDGRIVVVKPDPIGLQEITYFQALDGKTWNPAILAGRFLLVRNDKQAACYDLKSYLKASQ